MFPCCVAPLLLQVQAALAHKEKGNAAYKAGNLRRAITQYNQAVDFAKAASDATASSALPDEEPGSSSSSVDKTALVSQAKEVKKSSWLNLAAAHMKLQEYGDTVKYATQVGVGWGEYQGLGLGAVGLLGFKGRGWGAGGPIRLWRGWGNF
jgi:tetratricopeptide (TPR) repeat protein